jgi:transcriptional regulator with XRE-family HTH domain
MKDGAEKNARERFGHFLRANGERLFANQADLAHVLDISPAYVSKWYRGDVAAHTPEMLRRWASALQMPVSRILIEAGYLTHADLAAADPTAYVNPLVVLLGERLPPLVTESDVELVAELAWAARHWAERHGAPEVRTAGQTTRVDTTPPAPAPAPPPRAKSGS